MAQYVYSAKRGGTHQVLLDQIPADAGRVLDVGCASGYLGQALAQRGSVQVWGVDADETSVQAARAAGYHDVACLDLDGATDLPFNGPFDAIIAGDVLEHLRSPEPLLEALTARLAPGAPLVISLPNVANVAVRLNLLRGRFDYTDSGILDRTHLHLYTYRSARKFVQDNKLRIVSEAAGSGAFGRWLNSRRPGAVGLRPLLAHSIVLTTLPV